MQPGEPIVGEPNSGLNFHSKTARTQVITNIRVLNNLTWLNLLMARTNSASPLTTFHWLQPCCRLTLVPRDHADTNRLYLFLVTLSAPPHATRISSVINYVKKERELHRHVYWKTEFSQLQTSFQAAEKQLQCALPRQNKNISKWSDSHMASCSRYSIFHFALYNSDLWVDFVRYLYTASHQARNLYRLVLAPSIGIMLGGWGNYKEA